jgi:hypothetical protein
MKFETIKKRVPGQYNTDGSAKIATIKTPVLPKDYQVLLLRSAIGIVVAMTLVAMVWSVWSIGTLLGGGVAFMVAVIFDIGWAVSLMLEYLARYDELKRKFPSMMGWAMLVITMIAIGWHGMSEGSLAMGVIGAFVSFFAKLLWIGVMKHVNAQLTDEDKDRLSTQVSEAQAKAAIAQVRRQTARIEQHTTLEMLAMEREVAEIREAFGMTTTVEQVSDVEVLEEPKRIELEAPKLTDMKKSDATRYVQRQVPDASYEEIVEILADNGVETTVAEVRQTFNRKSKAEPEVELADVVNLRK